MHLPHAGASSGVFHDVTSLSSPQNIPPTAPEASRQLRWHLAQLDALRGIAVMGVVLAHCGLMSVKPWKTLTFAGQRGVQLFFIVSAFTLYLSNENRKQEPRPELAFFLRRFFRLAPMYYLVFLLTPIAFPEIIQPLPGTILQILFLHGLLPSAINTGVQGSWSLTNEAFFYFTLPFLFRWITNLRIAVRTLCIVAPVSFVVSYGLAHTFKPLGEYFTFLWFPVEVPVFLMGIAAFFAWKERLRTQTGTPAGRRSSLRLILVAALLFVPLIRLHNLNLLPSSLGLACFTLAVAQHPWPLLVNRVTILLGKVSYSIYLLHFFFLYWLFPIIAMHTHLHRPGWMSPLTVLVVRYLLVLGSATATSLLTWKFVEQPGIRLGRVVIARLQHRPVPPHDVSPSVPFKAAVSPGDSPDAQF